MSNEVKPKIFLLDVDGVMTTGHFIYSENGKMLKIFGPDDNDGLSLVASYLDIRFVTGDKRGFKISQKRIVEDMGYDLDLVSTIKRIDWIKKKFTPEEVIYMGDGIFDHYVMKEVGYGIAPSNANPLCKNEADYITKNTGGDRAVAEACLHILGKFFKAYDPNRFPFDKGEKFGEWAV